MIFGEYDQNFSMGSLDEAYLDVTECVANRIFPSNCFVSC